jgi:hypothetical protein
MMIYIDESGSINNHDSHNEFFIISLVCTRDPRNLKHSYKKFVTSNMKELQRLDSVTKIHPVTGKTLRESGKMFSDGKFRELKGSQFDRPFKSKFVDYFFRKPSFELFYIQMHNPFLTDTFCANTARAFNYTVRLAIEYLIENEFLPSEDYFLQIDERNERPDSKAFLKQYLNTELGMSGTSPVTFDVRYFDSANNSLIQVADVFANLYYSHLKHGNYDRELQMLRDSGILKFIFKFPLSPL